MNKKKNETIHSGFNPKNINALRTTVQLSIAIALILLSVILMYYYVAYHSLNRNAVKLVCIIIAAVFVLIVAMLQIHFRLRYKQHNEILEASLKEIRHNQEEKAKQLALLQSMAEIYYSIHLINLRENSFEEYAAVDNVKKILLPSLPADEAMSRIIHATITDAYVESGLRFTDINTLSQRMQNTKTMSIDMLGKYIGWVRLSFITIDEDENGFPYTVVVTTQSIDADKKREETLWLKSTTDELTGFLNRRAYDDAMMHDDACSDDLIYVVFDINGLKNVNDTLGHAAGDELIDGCAKCILQSFGKYGKLFRTGGDEAVAIIHADFLKFSDILFDFEDVQNNWSGKLVQNLSISVGYCSRHEFPDMPVYEMAKIADKRMYAAKAKHYRAIGVDRLGQSAAQAAMCASYSRIMKVNLTADSCRTIFVDSNEHPVGNGSACTFSAWLADFGHSENVCPDDQSEFLRKTELSHLRDYFRQGNYTAELHYRKLIDGAYKCARMEMLPAKDYTDTNQSMFLFEKQLEK